MILDSPQKISQSKTGNGKRQILYVEDDRNSQFLVEQILRDSYDVDIAPHAKDVLYWVGLKQYDLILMDIKLDEDYSGLDLTKQIRQLPQYREIPIIAVTAIAFPDELENMLKQGCTDVVTKPIDFKVFKLKIKNCLAQRHYLN